MRCWFDGLQVPTKWSSQLSQQKWCQRMSNRFCLLFLGYFLLFSSKFVTMVGFGRGALQSKLKKFRFQAGGMAVAYLLLCMLIGGVLEFVQPTHFTTSIDQLFMFFFSYVFIIMLVSHGIFDRQRLSLCFGVALLVPPSWRSVLWWCWNLWSLEERKLWSVLFRWIGFSLWRSLDSEGIMDLVNDHLLVVLVNPLLRTLFGCFSLRCGSGEEINAPGFRRSGETTTVKNASRNSLRSFEVALNLQVPKIWGCRKRFQIV